MLATTPKGTVYYTCYAPDVGVMVQHPSACSIHYFRSWGASNRQILYHPEKSGVL